MCIRDSQKDVGRNPKVIQQKPVPVHHLSRIVLYCLTSVSYTHLFMNFRVADIQACYELWKSRGAEFITPPIPKYGEIRCYIRDPDGYIIEVGQSTDLTYG